MAPGHGLRGMHVPRCGDVHLAVVGAHDEIGAPFPVHIRDDRGRFDLAGEEERPAGLVRAGSQRGIGLEQQES